jgi:hydrogenase-4 component F
MRCKVLADGALDSRFAGNMMMGFGLLSVVVAAFFLSRQRDVKRMFAYSSIEHMGLMTFAFGMGGPIANFAGLLHMTVHSLVKSAIFFAVGHATQSAGTQAMDDIRGLLQAEPHGRLGLMIGTLAILGHAALRRVRERVPDPHHGDARAPWATPILLLSLGVAFAAVFRRVQPMVFGDTTWRPSATSPRSPGVRAPGARAHARASISRPTSPRGTTRRRSCWADDAIPRRSPDRAELLPGEVRAPARA